MRTGLTVAAALVWLGLSGAAAAQNPYSPALTVNDGVITHYDIGQRTALLSALGAGGDLAALAVEQLTEDRVKVQAAGALGIELPEGALAAGLEEFATARGLTLENVQQILSARGIDPQTMDDFVQAGLMWREVLGTRFRERALPSDADLDVALELAAATPREVLQLAEIALSFEERGEAETLALAQRLSDELSRGADFGAAVRRYSRSATVAQGGVLPPVAALELPPAIRSEVLVLSPGEVTRPIPIAGGVAILRLISVRQQPPQAAAAPDDDAAREALRQRLFAERIDGFGQGYLQELLRDALILER